MNKKEIRHEQLSFSFDKEYPSLLEPLRQKENEFGASSPELIPLKIKLINFYFEKGDINNVYEYLKSLIELGNFANNEDLPLINFYEQLSDPANFVDQNIPSAGMIDQLNQITALKIIEQKEEKQEGLRPVIISPKTEHVLHGEG